MAAESLGIRTIRRGILQHHGTALNARGGGMLIIPPMFMPVGMTWLAYRKRNQFGEEIGDGRLDEGWECFEE